MLQAYINDLQVVIRFSLSYQHREELQEEEIIRTVLQLDEKLLTYIDDCLACKGKNGELIIIYVQPGEVLDVQIQQVIVKENILS
ncbi:hypothetical protein JOC85_004121 [Bacillus mesophilus]|uniref:Uncharacterized protein n=1 Tax=Bacillus mesophilus TaxID=1808955 RepID=A0A6M0QC21_9BACI|nr:hypothetical protein [Bacillus mesophilus]MBM7663250.1 hypothetical protein [Bacillus mesophilus]NEY73912.1 hypothetical protein [Bacillus mesophilus]